MISGRRIFFLPCPSPLSFFRPSSYRKGYYFYSPQSSTVIKSKMAATSILRTRTRFRPPKIRLYCRLTLGGKTQFWNVQDLNSSARVHVLTVMIILYSCSMHRKATCTCEHLGLIIIRRKIPFS